MASVRIITELAADYLKIVKAIQRPSGAAVSFCEVIPIVGLSDDDIASRLKQSVARARLSGQAETIAIIPRQHVLIRFLSLPATDLEELRQMVELQAFRQIPYAKGEVVSDFLVISREATGYSKVMVVMVPRDIFSRQWAVYRKAGFLPKHVTISSFGVVAWASRIDEADHIVAVVDVEETGSEICIAEGKRLLSSREIPFGAKELEEGKSGEIIRQLELTVNGFEKEHSRGPVSKIIVLGAVMTHVEEILNEGHERLRQPFWTGDFIRKTPIFQGMVWPQEVLTGKTSVVATSGLALSDSPLAVDLVPSEVREEKQKRRINFRAWRTGIVSVVALAALIVALSLPSFKQNAQLTSLEGELRSLKPKVLAVQAMSEEINEIESVLSRKVLFADVVKDLYLVVPTDFVLTSFQVDSRQKVTIEGYCINRESVDAFQRAMEQAATFKDIKFDYINKRLLQIGEVNYFKMSYRIARGP